MKKKYSIYKDSGIEWVGQIPKHWVVKNLKYSFLIKKGKLPKVQEEEYFENALPYLSMETIRGKIVKYYTERHDGVYIEKNDIGILWDGANSGEIIQFNREGILSSTISKLTNVDPNLIDSFGYYLLKFLEKDFRNNTIGMGIPHMDGDHLKYSSLIIPPLFEQKQIVSYLDKKTELIDSLIKNKKRKIKLLQEKRNSLINEIITKGLDPDVKMKDSGVEWIGEIPENWLISQIRRFTDDHRQGYYDSKGYTDSGHRVVRITDLKENNIINISKSPYYEMSDEDKSRYELRKGDFLFQRTGSHKKIGVFNSDEPSVYASYLIRFRFSKNININYLKYFFNSSSYKSQLNQQIHGGVNPNIHVENIKTCYTTFPPLEEQNQIVKFLNTHISEIVELIKFEKQKIKILEEFRQSLISEVVTGKIKVCEEDLSIKQPIFQV